MRRPVTRRQCAGLLLAAAATWLAVIALVALAEWLATGSTPF